MRITKKTCTVCKQPKARSMFYKDRSRADGLCDRCKQCDNARVRGPRKPRIHFVPVTEKLCTKCGVTKPAAAFSKNSRSKDGLYQHCKSSAYLMEKKWRSVPGRNNYKTIMRDLKQNTPKWADRFRLRLMYEGAAKMRRDGPLYDWELHHIIPLKAQNHAGKHIASGLHTHENLRLVDHDLNVFIGSRSWEMFMPDVYGEKYWRPDWPAEGVA